MKQQIDALVAANKKLQQFLSWANQKSLSVKPSYKPAAIRAFYLAIAADSMREHDYLQTDRLAPDLALDLALVFARKIVEEPEAFGVTDTSLARHLDLDLCSALAVDIDFYVHF